jgi:hypothetical protein
MQIVASIAGLGSLICWVIILVQMFQKDTVLKAILGIICGLWAFIWGWMNLEKHGQKTVMIVWSLCFVIGVIANVMVAGQMADAG